MWGMISKITTAPGKREEMIGILQASAGRMPGCRSYIVAVDTRYEDVLWVTETWESAASHEASLSLPEVKAAIPKGRAIVTGFERIAVMEPVWDGAEKLQSH